jgi:bifunctional non-homologous end joining protein LigD
VTLEEYKRKRKFEETPEPKPVVKKTGKKRFVVQKHQATHLHYDFRLEIGGVLKSWAVPKGVPEKPGIKRLAVEVEDHPVDYINFEGTIPEGLYGAGKVEIWDSGTYKKLKIKYQKSKINELNFILEGKKLKGEYAMIKTKWIGRKNQWLIFKK